MKLTPTQEDYLEVIYMLAGKNNEPVRVTDIAHKLGCKMPTVSRTVKKLKDGDYVSGKERHELLLTKKGKKLAHQITHRHKDIENFLTKVLCLPEEQAKADTCKIEHGFSTLSCQRLHAFMKHFKSLDKKTKQSIRDAVKHIDHDVDLFGDIGETEVIGNRI